MVDASDRWKRFLPAPAAVSIQQSAFVTNIERRPASIGFSDRLFLKFVLVPRAWEIILFPTCEGL